MIKQTIHKIFSVFLALVVLVSTVSFTIEKHFCGDVLIDIAMFSDVKKCSMEALEIELEKITKKSCCKDIVDVVEGQDELNFKAFDDLDFKQQLFVASFTYTYIYLFEGLQKQIVPHKDYSPPNLTLDIQLVDQVFII